MYTLEKGPLEGPRGHSLRFYILLLSLSRALLRAHRHGSANSNNGRRILVERCLGKETTLLLVSVGLGVGDFVVVFIARAS